MTKFKTIYAGEVDLSELPVEIERFNYATCTKCFHISKRCHSIGVLQWLTERGLRDSAPYSCLCLKLYLTGQFLLQAVRQAFQWLG